MLLDVLPHRSDSAAGNMAADFLLLQRYPEPGHARLRTYGWHRPAFTFGLSQKIAWVRAQLPRDAAVELARRPTGGGLVDHREDWTYALVIPRGHALYDARAIESYRAVHEALAAALHDLGLPAMLKRADAAAPVEEDTGTCFRRAEPFDLIRPDDGAKIAGAAQKRNKRGLLLQGSLWRPTAGVFDGDALAACLAQHLARRLDATLHATPWPEYGEDELSTTTEQFASPEWTEQR